MVHQVGPCIGDPLLLCIVTSEPMNIVANESSQLNNRSCERFEAIDRIGVKLYSDTLSDDPRFPIVVVFLVWRVAEIVVEDREVVQERVGPHEHEVFLVNLRRGDELFIGLLQRQPAKILPSTLFIQTATMRIKVVVVVVVLP